MEDSEGHSGIYHNPPDTRRGGSYYARIGSYRGLERGVASELANITLYDEFLAQSGLPSDVIRVFTSNRAVSLDRHLPAFQRCAG